MDKPIDGNIGLYLTNHSYQLFQMGLVIPIFESSLIQLKLITMFNLPVLKKLNATQDINFFAETYLKCSGLAVPNSYLETNQVFGIYINKQMIGGFILGSGDQLRTIEFFAAQELHESLYTKMKTPETYTEICCFWIDRAFRKKTMINYFVWLAMAFSLKAYGTENIIFGTCSRRLADLYSITPRSVFLHSDRMKNKNTFIYTAKNKGSVRGILHIVFYKFKRKIHIEWKRMNKTKIFRTA